MQKALGIGVFVVFALSVWSVGPLVVIAGNVLFRPGYHMRDLGSEYRARLLPDRVRWYHYRAFRLDCAAEGQRQVVLLHTSEFSETPLEFLSRRFPECLKVAEQKDKLPSLFSGILLGRW